MRFGLGRVRRALVAVSLCGAVLASVAAHAAEAPVSGTFKGNGKPAKLAFASAQVREAFNDKPAVVLIFTEKDHSKDAKPAWNAGFGRLGSALVVSIFEDGGIFGCEIAHAAHTEGSFSSIGAVEIKDFKIADGKVSGRMTSAGEQTFFKRTWEVDLAFNVPLPKDAFKPAGKPVAEKPITPANTPSDKPVTVKPVVAAINAHTLPPANATDVEMKQGGGFIDWKSPQDVKTATDAFIKQLAAQGWKKEGSDLITPKSVILRRKQGEASLVVFVKPEGTGSKVSIHSKGLSWEAKQ